MTARCAMHASSTWRNPYNPCLQHGIDTKWHFLKIFVTKGVDNYYALHYYICINRAEQFVGGCITADLIYWHGWFHWGSIPNAARRLLCFCWYLHYLLLCFVPFTLTGGGLFHAGNTEWRFSKIFVTKGVDNSDSIYYYIDVLGRWGCLTATQF